MNNISIIRNRGQLTIPDQVRRQLPWATASSAVSISVANPGEIIIRPHHPQINWDQIRRNIKKSRNLSGTGTKSAADFLEHDRRRNNVSLGN